MRRFLLAVGLMVLAAAPAQAGEHGDLSIGMVEFPADLHPFTTPSVAKFVVLRAALRGVTIDDGTARTCQLCTELPTVENGRVKIVKQADGTDGMEVTYTLLPGLAWGDGVPVTGADMSFSFQLAQWFAPQRVVTAVEAVDAQNFRVKLSSVRPDYADLVPMPIAEHIEGAIARGAHDAQEYGRRSAFNRAPQTPGLWLGPYRVTALKPSAEVDFEPNEHWAGTKPAFAKVSMRRIESMAVLETQLVSGAVDVPMPEIGLALEKIVPFTRQHAQQFSAVFEPTTNLQLLALNLGNKLLADVRIRRALLMAIDRQAMVNKLFEGHAEIPLSSFNAGDFGFDPKVRKYNFDPKAARALFAEAGFRPGPDGFLADAAKQRLSLEISTVLKNEQGEQLEQMLQTQLKAVGVELVTKNETATILFGGSLRFRTFPGMVLYTKPRGPGQLPSLSTLQIPDDTNNHAGSNYAGFSNAEMDAAYAELQHELDSEKRAQLLATVQRIEADMLPNLPLYFIPRGFVVPKWLTGMTPMPAGQISTGRIELWRVK